MSEARRPTVAVAILVVFGALLCAPLASGHLPAAGYAWRQFVTDAWRAHGFPEWNPYHLGGLPTLTAPQGDAFYPTAWLRLIAPLPVAIAIASALHVVLAGVATFALLRTLRLSAAAALTGAIAYELSGPVAARALAGPDSALYAAALLPLALVATVRGVRDGAGWGFGVLGLAVGCALLAPDPRGAALIVVAAGAVAGSYVFVGPDRVSLPPHPARLAGALLAALGGGAMGAVLGTPLPATHALPPLEALSLLVPLAPQRYLGVAAVMLATAGLTWRARPPFARAAATLGVPAIAAGLLVDAEALALATLCLATLAALGVERLLAADAPAPSFAAWLGVLALVLLLTLAGVFSHVAPPSHPPLSSLGALRLAAFGAGLYGLAALWRARRLTAPACALGVALLVGIDLWSVDRFTESPPVSATFGEDAIITRIRQTPGPYRVIDASRLYAASALLGQGIPEVLGEGTGGESPAYDALLGGRGAWRNLRNRQVWALLGVRFIVIGDAVAIPGFRQVLGPPPVVTSQGRAAYLYEAEAPSAWARVVPAAVKAEPASIMPTVLDPRMDFDRLVLFDTTQRVNPYPLTEDSLPPPSQSRATIASWTPGHVSVQIAPEPQDPSYLVVAENWDPGWQATVDGAPAPVYRGDQALVAVPVPEGARRVELVFESARYRRGRWVSLAAALALAVAAVVGAKRRG